MYQSVALVLSNLASFMCKTTNGTLHAVYEYWELWINQACIAFWVSPLVDSNFNFKNQLSKLKKCSRTSRIELNSRIGRKSEYHEQYTWFCPLIRMPSGSQFIRTYWLLVT